MSELLEQSNTGDLSEGACSTDDDSTTDEHAQICGKGIEESTENQEDRSNSQSPLASPFVTDVRGEERRDNGWKEETGRDETQDAAGRMVEVFLPLRDSLEAVHERGIEAKIEDTEVEANAMEDILPQSCIFVPGSMGIVLIFCKVSDLGRRRLEEVDNSPHFRYACFSNKQTKGTGVGSSRHHWTLCFIMSSI